MKIRVIILNGFVFLISPAEAWLQSRKPSTGGSALGSGRTEVLEKFYYGSATKSRPFKRWRPERGLTTEKYEKEINQWEKLLKQVGCK
jgi:hypothetical protein